MFKICVAFLFSAALVTGLMIVRAHVRNEQVNVVGESLARWANHHQITIRINGKPIQIVDSVGFSTGTDFCRKSSHISWQSESATKSDNQLLRGNLEGLIKKSGCGVNEVINYLRVFDDAEAAKRVSPEKLAAELGCLGSFEFEAVGDSL